MSLRDILMACWVALALVAGAPATAQQPPARHMKLALVPESAAPAPGSTIMLAVRAKPDPGWHGYWTNPGDAGVPDRFDWRLPAGASVGSPRYPVPHQLLIAGIMNYVYEGEYSILVPLTVPADAAPGTRLPIAAAIDYLICTREVCVPESAQIATELRIGDGTVEPARQADFDRWRTRLPRPIGSPATFATADGTLRLAIPLPAGVGAAKAYFFPAESGLIDQSAPQTLARTAETLVITTKPGANAANAGVMEGVLALDDGTGLSLRAARGMVAAAPTTPSAGGDFAWGTLLAALGGAVLGGLILNVMPCVFPILSLKALSLARSGIGAGAARREALAYAAGVVLVCTALGAAILGLRAGGAAVGWAFQLQEPLVILALLLLTTAIAFNLAGLFEIGGPGFANRLAASGRGGAFLTGALAALVATPCTGPFMGAALGAALVLPPVAALAVFAGLGLGLALPFLAIGFVPALRARLPRPGAWMERLRHILAVPMFLTALALAWVLGRQTGSDGMALGLTAAVVLAIALWWTGRRQAGGRGGVWIPLVPAAAAAVAIAVVVPRSAPASVSASTAAAHEPFTEARLATLRAERRPVFAYFTADWCVTCKVNEKVAIARPEVRAAFDKGGVAVMVGDWTNGDAALGRFLETHGRSGVPLYLYYKPGEEEPLVLPQILTPAMLTGLTDS